MLPTRVRLGLWVQRTLGHILFPIFGFGVVATAWFRGYQFRELAELRRRFGEITRTHTGPLLICANHLTKVDSCLTSIALASNWTYFRRFHLLPWNLPEYRRYANNLGLRLLCYLGKCIPILRDGSADSKRRVMAKLEYLLQQGETVSIFPEGKRSVSGRLDTEDFGYGIGQLASRVDNVSIVCVYLRGESQMGATSMPPAGDTLYADIRVFRPCTANRGLRAARDISVQTIQTLHEMERQYVAQAIAGDPVATLDAPQLPAGVR